MYGKEKYGITFSVDARVELIFGIVSKLKKEYKKYENLKSKNYDEELDFIEISDTEYSNNFYDLIDFEKYPKILKWAEKLADLSDQGMIPSISMMFDENFNKKKDRADYTQYKSHKDFMDLLEIFDSFAADLKEFVQESNYLDFYKKNSKEFHKMIEEGASEYPENLDIKDIDKFYGISLEKYPVIYSAFFNGGFGPKIEGIPTCFKGLWIDENGKYFESAATVINLYHEYSHPIINPLVDKYWNLIENKKEFLEYSKRHNLVNAYNEEKALYYEYFVRATSCLLGKKYQSIETTLEWYDEIGFVKTGEIISYIENNYNGNNFEIFFKEKLIPFINEMTSNLEKKESRHR